MRYISPKMGISVGGKKWEIFGKAMESLRRVTQTVEKQVEIMRVRLRRRHLRQTAFLFQVLASSLFALKCSPVWCPWPTVALSLLFLQGLAPR